MSNQDAQAIYDRYRDELYKRELSNTESFDKAILSLSSAGLAISLTFIKSIVPISNAIFVCWLYASWVLFGCSIISTVLSLMSSQFGIKKQLEIAEQYYINQDEKAFEKVNVFAKATDVMNVISGILFIFAIISVIVFSVMNFRNHNLSTVTEELTMSNDSKKLINNGQTVPKMQRTTFKDGASVPAMQKVQPKPQGDTSKTSSSKGE